MFNERIGSQQKTTHGHSTGENFQRPKKSSHRDKARPEDINTL
jgi:hypothetical protein